MNLIYLNGLYQAKTESLLSNEDLNAIKNMDKESQLSFLKNKGYKVSEEEVGIEPIITNEKIKVREELDKLTNDTLIGDLIFIENDLNNIKIAIKSIEYDIDIINDDNVSKYDIDSLIQFFKHDNKSLISDADHDILEQIKKIDEKNIKLKIQKVEQIYYDYQLSKIDNHKYEPLVNYFNNKRVIKNIENFLKLRIKNASKDKYENILLNQDILEKKEFIDLIDKNDEEVVNRFNLLYYGKLEESIKLYLKQENLIQLKKDSKEILDEIALELSYNNNKIGPIISYLHFKMEELGSLRWLYYDK